MSYFNPPPASDHPPRIALIGVTGYGKVHWDHLLKTTNQGLSRPVAAVVINPEEAKEACTQLSAMGARLYTDYSSMLREEKGGIDLCLIPTGIHWHAPMTIAALEAGCDVLVEKPLCGGDEEAASMLKTSRETGRFIAVGFQDLYDPHILEIKKLVLGGKLGRIKRIRGWALWPRGASYYGRNSWAGRLRVDGKIVLDSPFNNAMAHFLNLLLFFGGETFGTMAEVASLNAEFYRTRPIESFDTGSLLARTSSGIELIFHGSHSCARDIHPRIWIEGEKGTILWHQHAPTQLQIDGNESDLFPLTRGSEKMQNMMHAILSRPSNPSQWICSAEMASAHTHLINRLHRDFPIRDLPPSFYGPDEKTGIPVINGIEEHIVQASENGSLLGALLPA